MTARLRTSMGPERACQGKKRYTKLAARAVARQMARVERLAVAPYRCEHCPHWHIGHLPEGVRDMLWWEGRLPRRVSR